MDNNNPAAVTMLYDANKKSLLVAYLLWFFLGGLGGHRFYVGKTGSAVGMIALLIVGSALAAVGIGAVLLMILGIWVIVDAFLIPKWIRIKNTQLANTLASGGQVPN
ncbi:TM2 domain-containing protein [Candidimonas nitroreducens]